ncbi:RDD family protein [Ameyamaea chiangmaiensis]|uniref:RDD family protein n=2 Tax=Ameyamaea chiangmaiensis TaxID=442969 RepID=A0A850PC59_9PROT|nr:RDD family protein [Ameyamaea chiangmaiensis]NVN42097.1 RDD family protein [Ameyamaea chiangmaiensis]
MPVPEARAWVFAGFWWRVLAYLIDVIALGMLHRFIALAFTPAVTITYGGASGEGASDIAWRTTQAADFSVSSPMILMPHVHWHGSGVYESLSFLLPALYYILFEASALRATPGKLACRMRVTDLHGRRIGLLRAGVRYFAKFLSLLTLGVGFLMAGWTLRKQALHDLIAETVVIRSRPTPPVLFTPSS